MPQVKPPFKDSAEAFNVLSQMPQQPIPLGGGRELHIVAWNPKGDTALVQGSLSVSVRAVIKLTKEAEEARTK